MNQVRFPSEFFYSLQYASCKEYGALVIVFEEFSALRVCKDSFSVEIVVIVYEIDLHSCRRYGGDLYYERSVHITYHYV